MLHLGLQPLPAPGSSSRPHLRPGIRFSEEHRTLAPKRLGTARVEVSYQLCFEGLRGCPQRRAREAVATGSPARQDWGTKAVEEGKALPKAGSRLGSRVRQMLEPADPHLSARPHAAVTEMPVSVTTLCSPSRGVTATAANCGQAVVPNSLPGQGDLSRGRIKGQIGSASRALGFVPVRVLFSLPPEVSHVRTVSRGAGTLSSWRSGEPSHGPPLLSDKPATPLTSLPWSPREALPMLQDLALADLP